MVYNDAICDSDKSVRSDLVGVRDTVIRPLLAEPEGAPRDYTISEFICVNESG